MENISISLFFIFSKSVFVFRIVQTAAIQGGGSEQKAEEEEDLTSDEESIRIYPIKATKRKSEVKDSSQSEEKERSTQPPKPKRSKPDFCFKTRDY